MKLAKFCTKKLFYGVNLKDNFDSLSEETEKCGDSMNTNHLSSMMFYKTAQLAKSKGETNTLISGEIT